MFAKLTFQSPTIDLIYVCWDVDIHPTLSFPHDHIVFSDGNSDTNCVVGDNNLLLDQSISHEKDLKSMIIENIMTMCGLNNSCVDILIKLYDKKIGQNQRLILQKVPLGLDDLCIHSQTIPVLKFS